MKKLFLTTSLVAIAAGFTPAAAQQATATGETNLSTIVVTPMRRESTLASSTASVTVIDRAAIEKSPTQDITQFLKSYTGVSVISTGGLGSSSSVSLRGMGSARTLVLVNGVRVGSATLGAVGWSNIPLESIERIEIVKGPRSSAYGADAMGGVINIITREGGMCAGGKAVCGSITAGVSHPWGGFTSGEVRGEKDGTTFAIGANLIGTRGYNYTFDGLEPDDDGFIRGSMNFAVSKRFDWGKLYADGLFSRSRGQYDSTYLDFFTGLPQYPSNELDSTAFFGRIGAEVDHTDDWSSKIELTHGLDRQENFRNGVAGGEDYVTNRTGILANTVKTFETGEVKHTAVLGGEFYKEQIKIAPNNYDATDRDLFAGYGQYSLAFGDWNFDSGVRYDYNEQFGDAWTYNLGVSYDVMDDLTVRTSWGTGFRAPTFNDLYYPLDGWGMQGNPNLRAEHSKSLEAGLTWQVLEGTKLDIAVYRNWLKDGIVWGAAMPTNISRMTVTGLEVSASHVFNDRFAINGGIDWRDPRDESTGKYVRYVERFKANAGFTFAATEALTIDVSALYGSGAFTNDANTTRLGSYLTFDASVRYKLDDQSSFKLAAENLLDKDYATNPSYRAPGRTVTFSFTRKF